jgi:hypothetical protein
LALAALAVLDCIGDAAARRPGNERTLALDTPRKVVAIQFRSTSLKGWRAAGAKLVVHFERGRCEGHLLAGYAAKFDEKAWPARTAPPSIVVPCAEAGAGWWEIDLPGAIAQRLVDEPNGAIVLASPAKRGGPVLHSRETMTFTPRLLVEGVAP